MFLLFFADPSPSVSLVQNMRRAICLEPMFKEKTRKRHQL